MPGRVPPTNFRLRPASLAHIKKCETKWGLNASDVVRVALLHLWETRSNVDAFEYLKKLTSAKAKERQCSN